jgi:hypothetical protein
MLYDMIVQASSKTKHKQLTNHSKMTYIIEDRIFTSNNTDRYSFMALAKDKDLNFGVL